MSKLTEIIEQFSTNSSNKKLYYADRNIGVSGAKLLAEAIKCNKISELSELHLKGNIGSEGTTCLVEAVMTNNNLLSKLNLEDCNIGDNGAKALAEAAKKRAFCNLVDLKLYKNNITSVGAKALAEAAEERFFPKLSILHLSSNKISDNGAKALAEAAKNQGFPKLEALHLYWNNIGYDGIKELITSYRDCRTAFPALLDLNFNENRIGDDGLEIFQDTVCYLRTLEIREDSGSKGWFTGNQGFGARKITVKGINELKNAGEKGFFPILSHLNISGNGWNIQDVHKLVDTLKLENEENAEVYFPALSSLTYKNFQIWQVCINYIIENTSHCHRNILHRLNLEKKARTNCEAKSDAENKFENEVWERLPGIVKESFIAAARADLLEDDRAKMHQLSAAINMMTKYYINNDDIENEFKSVIQWWKKLVKIDLEYGKKLFNITLLDKNGIYYKEIKDLIDLEEQRESAQEKFRYLSEALRSNTEELNEIRVILETKANLGDIEYVNEEIQEISGSRYDDAQKIKMLYQLLVGVKQRVDVQDATIVNFKLHVEQKFNEYKDDISNLFNKFSQLQVSSNLTTEQLSQLISETETHAKLITGLNNDIKRINDTIDPSVVEFMHNYQDQRAVLDTVIQIIQEYKDINPVANNEQLAGILREEIERAKKELGNEIQDINAVLRETKIYKKAQLSKDFANLEGSDAGVYVKAFASSLYTYIESYQLAKEGLFQVTEEKLTPDFVASSLKAIPVIGNALDAITTCANNIYATKDAMTKEQRIKKIDAIIKNNFILDDIKLYVSEVALKMIENSTVKRLLSSDQQHSSHGFLQKMIDGYAEIKEALDMQLDLLKQVITGIDAVDDKDFIKISKLALEHVGLFMEALCRKNGEKLPESLEEFISTQIFAVLEKEEQASKDVINSKCVICYVNDIQYDNQLLNYPEMFNKLAEVYDSNKVLELSTQISPLLIYEAIHDDNIDLLLGGLMSLDDACEQCDSYLYCPKFGTIEKQQRFQWNGPTLYTESVTNVIVPEQEINPKQQQGGPYESQHNRNRYSKKNFSISWS